MSKVMGVMECTNTDDRLRTKICTLNKTVFTLHGNVIDESVISLPDYVTKSQSVS